MGVPYPILSLEQEPTGCLWPEDLFPWLSVPPPPPTHLSKTVQKAKVRAVMWNEAG